MRPCALSVVTFSTLSFGRCWRRGRSWKYRMRWSEGVAPGRTEVGSADVARDRLDSSKCRSHTSGASHWSWQNFADDAEQRGRSWRPWTGAQMLVGGHLGPIEQELQA